MKGKMSLLTRKIFASIVAISMSIPPTAFASSPEPVVYDANSSIMGLAPKKEDQAKVENTDQTKIEKDLGDYSLEITSTLDESLTKIDYTIKAKRKNQAKNENPNQVSDENLSLTIAKTPTSNIKDIKLISASVETEEVPEIKGDLNSLTLKSKANDEIIYKLRADVRKVKDGRSYELIMGLKEDAANIFAYTLKAETGIRLVDNEEVQTIELIHKDEKLSKAKGDYKKEGILGGLFASHDTITWTDYIVNEEENNKEITYNFDLDQNQETANSQIGLDYYEQGENGFEIKKEFSQKIDFSKKVKFEIPKGFIAKLSLQTKVSKKNTKIKSYSLNNSRLKNPIYIEGNEEEKSNDEEDPAPADKNQKPAEKPAEEKKPSTEIKVDDKKSEENKNSESKKEEKNSDTQITVTDANGNEIPVEKKINPQKETISAIILNKDSLIAKLKSEGKLIGNQEPAIESLANNLNSYNEGKITGQDLKDFTKALALNNKIEKSDLRSYLEAILSGLNKQTNKAANLNIDEIITYAYPEKKESPIKVDDKKTEEKPQDKKENQTKDKSSVEKSESKPAVEKKSSTQINVDDKATDEKLSSNQKSANKKDAETKENKGLMQNLISGLKSLFSRNTSLKDLSNNEKVDKSGKPIGTIIEPGKEDQYRFFENGKDYRVEMQANSSPVVENGKLTAIDWTVKFLSDHDLNDPTIDLRTNFTIVDGSGFDKIEQIYLNGSPLDQSVAGYTNKMDRFLIKDSKHHKADRNGKSYTYTFRTKVTQPQSAYTLDIAALLYGKNKKGAVRLVSQGYTETMLQDLTPNRASANNRTTIKGEFYNERTMIWKITDEVSTGDDGKLPLAKRSPDKNHARISNKLVKAAYYGLDAEGKMEKKETRNFQSLPNQGAYPEQAQQPGTIAVYQIETTNSIGSDNTYSLGGVKISLYQDLDARMTWQMKDNLTPPSTTVSAKTTETTSTPPINVEENNGLYQKDFVIPGVKIWDVQNGKYNKISPTISQSFDSKTQTYAQTTYNFVERSVNYDDYLKRYEIQNTVRKKTDEETGELNLDGKKFHVKTIFQTSNVGGPIQPGQYFKIHLDDKLTVNDSSTLKSIFHNGVEIAKPEYDAGENFIKYIITTPIKDNLNIPLDIPVDYNTSNITLDKDGTFTVINKVKGIGVTNPKALLPEKIDRNGNPAGTIIEPGRDDVIRIFDDEKNKNYSVNIDTRANPVIEDGKMQSINWTIRVHSTEDLLGLGYKLNLTAVEGSGLKEIKDVKINGQSVELKNQLENSTGIVDSKHHNLTESTNDLVYTFNTPVKTVQSAYMLDVSGILTSRDNLLGAVRLVLDDGYKADVISEATPTRVGMNNRTTIQGKFETKDTAIWTVTDGVSSGDNKGEKANKGLPWETRELGGSQKPIENSGKSVVYGIDTDAKSPTYGQMVVKVTEKTISSIPAKETDPTGAQAVGNIAVYKVKTNLTDATTDEKIAKDYSLGGVSISKYKDVVIEQIWNLPDGAEMPKQNIQVVDKADNQPVASKEVSEEAGKTRLITIPDVKFWDFVTEEGKNVYIAKKLEIKQNLPTEPFPVDGKQYKYNENSNYYKEDTKTYQIRNSAIESTIKTPANFTVVKVDSKDPTKKLSGAVFYLLGNNGVEVETDASGKAEFKNIAPGTYTLAENKAPEGYKLDQSTKIINIADNGEISVSGDNIQLLAGAAKTEKVAHNREPNWPDYMNTMHYGKITTNGTNNQVEFYLYLKPDSDNGRGGTNKDTRLNISIPGVNITDVTAYDVDPANRNQVRYAMENQIIETEILQKNILGQNVINDTKAKKPIRGIANRTDSFTGRTGYQVYFPEERFNNDWGFLVKVKADIGTKDAASLSYDWLTAVNTAKETNLSKTVSLIKTSEDNKIPKLIVSNVAFDKSPIEVTKFADQFDTDGNRIKLEDAEFTLKDSEGKLISNKFADKDGKVDFGKFPPGTYILEEAKAPDGYQKSDVYFEVVVNEKGEVSYNAKFEDGIGKPTPGQDYVIEKGEDTGTAEKELITHVSQRLEYQENEPGDIGQKTGVWEAYRYESLKYHADINLSNTNPGTRFEIQFDPNLDFTQYFSSFPKISVNGVDVADPYFDYKTNLLTYVYNEKSKGGPGTATINLRGIIPSKFYAKESGSYPFTIKVGPKGIKTSGNPVIDKQMMNADYERYDTGTGEPSQSYYFRDVYKKEDGNWYVTAISYFNPLGDRSVGVKTLNYNWLTTTFQDQQIARWVGKGLDPLYKLNDIKIYRTEYERHNDVNGVPLNRYMPLSYGVRPEQDPYSYSLVYHQPIVPNEKIDRRYNDFRINYDPGRYDNNTLISNKAKAPLKITTPAIRNGEGYVIEQTFKITDIDQFNKTWRAFYMSNGNLESAFASKANVNTAIGDQTGGEIPKFYKEVIGLINRKYTPGQFKLIKHDELDPKKKLPNATFALTDEKGNTIYRESNSNGEVDFTNIAPGRYTLEEYSAPDKYQLTNKKWQVVVQMDGSVRILETSITGGGQSYTGNNKKIISIPVSNKPVGKKFRVYKKDGDGKPLPGAKFKITKPDGTLIFDEVASNDQGIVEFQSTLQEGETYILEETKAPDGYKEPTVKKWVLKVEEGKVKVYNYSKSTSQQGQKSILGEKGTEWIDVKNRNTLGWTQYDNRWKGWAGNSENAEYLGTRIIAKNTEQKYVIQRYIINPEGRNIGKSNVSIHRQLPEYPNMDWFDEETKFNKDTDIKVFTLDKTFSGLVSDLRLNDYKSTDITNEVKTSMKQEAGRFGEPKRLGFDLPASTKPIVIDIKVPYKDENGGVGTGMDWTESGTTYWKADHYEKASDIKTTGSTTAQEGGNIVGSYISEGSIDVTNEIKTTGFKLKKVKEGETPSPIQGAVFKLTGPGNSTDERTVRTGPNGIVSFDGLKPGEYTLEETQPAPGYEKALHPWKITITKDGKTYIREDKEARSTTNTSVTIKEEASLGLRSFAPIFRSARFANFNSIADNMDLDIGDDLIGYAVGAAKQTLNLENRIQKVENDAESENTGLEIGDNSVGSPVGAGDISAIGPYNVDTSNATIKVSAGAVDTTDGTRTINVSVSPKEGTSTGLIGKNLQYVFMIDRSQDPSTKGAADAPNIDKNINKFLTDLAEKAKANNTKIDVTFIEYSRSIANNYNTPNRNKSKVLGEYNQDLQSLYDSASSFTYNMKTQSFNDRNPVTAKNILGRVGISSRETITKSKDDGSRGLKESINNHYNQIIGNGKNYDKRVVLNIANFDALSADFYYETPGNTRSQKKYYIADNNWPFRDPTKKDKDKIFDSYILHIQQKSRQETEYEKYMRTNSGTWHIDKNENPQQGLYSYKGFLESNLMKDEYLKGTPSADANLVNNASINIGLNSPVQLKGNPSADGGNISYTSNGFSLNNINLKKNQTLNLSYTINLKETASDNTDYTIHSAMTYKPDQTSSDVYLDTQGMITRKEASTPTTFTVSHNTPENGTLSVKPTTAKAGDTITVTATPNTNYKLKSLYYRDGNGNQVNIVGNSFEMPSANVNVFAEFEPTTQPTEFNITTNVNDPELGSVTVDKNKAAKGDKVTVTVTPIDDTVEITEVRVVGTTIGPQLQNGVYTFKMPANDVTVSVTFNKKDVNTYYVSPTIEQGKGRVVVNPTSDMSTGYTKAAEGEKVTFSIRTEPGWQVKAGSVFALKSDGSGQRVSDLVFDGTNGSFTMPNTGVTINVIFKNEEIPDGFFVATVDPTMTGGNISVSQRIVKPGDRVRFTISPWDGYKNTARSVRYSQGDIQVPVQSDEQGYYFIMPKSHVTVSGIFQKVPAGVYKVKIGPTKNGRVYVSPTSANQGEEVTLSALADKGYIFESYSVTANGQALEMKGNKFTMPASAVNVSAKFKYVGDEITPGSLAEITNKQIGLELKVHKKNRYNSNLANAIFDLWKADENYNKVADDILAIGVSDENGLVEFKDKQGNKVNLPVGKYLLEETFAPLGYKKPTTPWKVEVVEENGKLVAKYQGPEETPSSFLDSEKAVDANQKDTSGNIPVTKTVNGIKYASRLTRINTEGKTYVQRIYIDTRNYKSTDPNNKENIVNVQIRPKYKREEIDTLGQPPVTIKEGVKTAYRSTYQIIGLETDPNQAKITDILQNYDVSKSDVKSVNTARWRPFDWGFDEDQLNLKPGVYYIDVEGFYDDVIITGESDKTDKYTIPAEDLGKIDLNIDFFDGPREFKQRVYDSANNKFNFEAFEGASYQGGMQEVAKMIEKLSTKADAENWADYKPDGQKYKNALSKEADFKYWYNGSPVTRHYDSGRIIPPVEEGKEGYKPPASHIPTRIDISSLYTSSKTNTVPQEGMTITNDDETYNITFSKHGKDDENEDLNSEAVTKRRLEGGVFKLQRRVGGDNYEDVEGSTVISAFNGYFGFRGLKPGRYRLMEIQAPKGYKPIDGPLLHFTVETVSLISDKIADPRNGQYIKMDDVDYYFPTSLDPYTLGTKAYKFKDIKMKDPTDNSKEILLKDARNIDLEKSKVINPETNQEVLFKAVSIKFPVLKDKDGQPLKDKDGKPLKDTYKISEIQVTPKSNGYISLEYDKANGVYQYVPEKSTSEKDGKLVDFVTSATAKNMGKIINTKPGKGEVTINKVDENGNALKGTANAQGELTAGAKFKLTNTLTNETEEKTVGTDGTLKFTGLKIGTYKLEEISSPDGHINTAQQWHFTVGGKDLDPYTADKEANGRNLTDKITLEDESTIKVVSPVTKNGLGKTEGEIHPHEGESLEFNNTYKIDSSVKIKPGDYFVVKLIGNIDLEGVFTDGADNLDIFADGVGTIAKAKYDKEAGTITYIFTDYAKSYDLVNFTNKITAFINLYKQKQSANKINVGMSIGNSTNNKDVKLVYDLKMLDYYDYEGNNLNMTSKIVKYNPKTGEFVHYYYINRKGTSLKRSLFEFSSDQPVENLEVRKLKLKDNRDVTKDMPESFGIDETSENIEDKGVLASANDLPPGRKAHGYLDDIERDDSYILKVTGKVSSEDKSKYNGYGRLSHYHGSTLIIEGYRYDQVYTFTNEATAKAELTIQAVNPANKIKFKKINSKGEALAGAIFQIYKKSGDNWNAEGMQPQTSDKDGLFGYEKLGPGEYKIKETTAPKGYDKLIGPVVEFRVDDKGVIFRKIPVRDQSGKIKKDDDGNIITTEVEEPGIVPIEIVNTQTKEIEFVKVDGADNNTVLEGAEFEIWFKKSKDLEYKKDNLKLYEKKDKQGTVTDRIALSPDETIPEGYEEVQKFVTGKDGKVKFKFREPGYYALKEIKAPKGYIAPKDFVKEFVLKDGKVLEENFKSEMTVNKSVGGVYANGWYDTYDTSINFTFNPNGEEITYTKGKSKLTLSGLPYNTEPWDNFYPQTGIKIDVYTVGDNGKNTFLKTIQLDKSKDYNISTSRGKTTIDLYELLKPAGHTEGEPFKSSQKLEFSMSSKLHLTTTLDIKSKIEIGDKKPEERTYHIGTEGNKKIAHSFKFSSLAKLTSPFNIENTKFEYPLTGGPGVWIGYTIGGLAVMIGGAYIYHKRRESIEANS